MKCKAGARRLYGVIPWLGLFLIGLSRIGAAITEPQIWLITPEEAARPPAPPDATFRGGLPFDIGGSRPDIGPIIAVLKPQDSAPQSSPIQISVRFIPRQQPIKIESVKVTLVKFISIDITDRVRPYLSDSGIEIPDAKLPSGEHTVRISVSDVTGTVSIMQTLFKIR